MSNSSNTPTSQAGKRFEDVFFAVSGYVAAILGLVGVLLGDSQQWTMLTTLYVIWFALFSLLISFLIFSSRMHVVSTIQLALIIASSVIFGIFSTHLYSAVFLVPDTPVERKIFRENEQMVVMEAENYSLSVNGSGTAADIRWETIKGAEYSNSRAVQAVPVRSVNTLSNINGPSLIYQIEFTNPATYTVDLRGDGPLGGRHDSVHVGVSGVPITTQDRSGTGVGFGKSPHWNDTNCIRTAGEGQGCTKATTQIRIPEAGTYNLQIWMREDGVILDKIILRAESLTSSTVKDSLPETIQ